MGPDSPLELLNVLAHPDGHLGVPLHAQLQLSLLVRQLPRGQRLKFGSVIHGKQRDSTETETKTWGLQKAERKR